MADLLAFHFGNITWPGFLDGPPLAPRAFSLASIIKLFQNGMLNASG